MSIKKRLFGHTASGQAVREYTLTNTSGSFVKMITYGAALTCACVPDHKGGVTDVVLGCDTVADYEQQQSYLGAVIGRCANRIQGGSFVLNQLAYHLAQNSDTNHHHGGVVGFDKQVFAATVFGDTLSLSLFSPNMDQGYPGNFCLRVNYTFDDTCTLTAQFFAFCDADTVANITLHPYFNLNGQGSGTALNHTLWLGAKYFTPVHENLIPTGQIAPVAGTPLCFTTPKPLGSAMDKTDEQIFRGSGLDHNFVLNSAHVCTLVGDKSHIVLKIKANYPGAQVYSGNFLQPQKRYKGGAVYHPQDGIAIEPQYFPNAINTPAFLSPILKAGQMYRKQICFAFDVTK